MGKRRRRKPKHAQGRPSDSTSTKRQLRKRRRPNKSPRTLPGHWRKAQVLRRGRWTPQAIEKFLSPVVKRMPGHRKPSVQYELSQVETVENSPLFIKFTAKTHERQQRDPGMKSALETRALVDQVSVKITHADVSCAQLRHSAIVHFKQRKPRSQFPVRGYQGAGKNWWRQLLGIIHAYVRHQLTMYDSHIRLLCNRVGKRAGYELLRHRVEVQTLRTFPFLRSQEAFLAADNPSSFPAPLQRVAREAGANGSPAGVTKAKRNAKRARKPRRRRASGCRSDGDSEGSLKDFIEDVECVMDGASDWEFMPGDYASESEDGSEYSVSSEYTCDDDSSSDDESSHSGSSHTSTSTSTSTSRRGSNGSHSSCASGSFALRSCGQRRGCRAADMGRVTRSGALFGKWREQNDWHEDSGSEEVVASRTSRKRHRVICSDSD